MQAKPTVAGLMCPVRPDEPALGLLAPGQIPRRQEPRPRGSGILAEGVQRQQEGAALVFFEGEDEVGEVSGVK